MVLISRLVGIISAWKIQFHFHYSHSNSSGKKIREQPKPASDARLLIMHEAHVRRSLRSKKKIKIIQNVTVQCTEVMHELIRNVAILCRLDTELDFRIREAYFMLNNFALNSGSISLVGAIQVTHPARPMKRITKFRLA